jgi:hypothetical protein
MNKLFNRLIYVCAVLLMLIPLVSCSGGGGGASGTAGGTTFWVTDGPTKNAYQAVYITIVEVEVNYEDDGWLPPLTDLDLPLQLELLTLTNGARAQLGIVDLEPGHYNQMRLKLSVEEGANFVIDSEDNIIDLKVPSGGQTGVKLVNGFDITGDSTDIVLDFDAHKSVHAHPAGKTDKWILRPTIKVVEIDNFVSGMVANGDDSPLKDAWVSAQASDPGADDPKNEITGVAGVSSLGDGSYFMLLPINTSDRPYNIVATKTVYEPEIVVYEPECQSLSSTASGEYIDVNFTLNMVPSGEHGALSGTIVNLPLPGDEDTYSVYLSIRQEVDCDGDDAPESMVEVDFLNFVNEDGTDIAYGPIPLPVGDYQIVAWADEEEDTLVNPVTVTNGADIPQDVIFP